MVAKINLGALGDDVLAELGKNYVSIRDYESFAVSGDWALALNQAVSELESTTVRSIWFPYDITDNNGNYSFKTKPNPFGYGVQLIGENPRQFLVRDYAPTGTPGSAANSFLVWDGSAYNGDPNQNKGGGMINLGLGAGNGTSGGVALQITGTDINNRGGYSYYANNVISVPLGSTGTWLNGLKIDGSAVTTLGSQGMRDNTFFNLFVFRCTSDAVIFNNNVHTHIHSMTVSDGGAGNPSPRVLFTGGGSAATNSTQCLLTNLDLECNLRFENCSRIVAWGYVDQISSALSATQCKFGGIFNTNSTTTGTTVI